MEFAGRIGKVVNQEIEKTVAIIAETRKGYNQKGILYNSSGEDSPPVKDDKIVILKVDGSGKGVIVGVFNETQGVKPGEKIFYARDENGKIKSKIYMLGNGKILIKDDGKEAARKTDKVKIKIPANTFIVSVSGQAVGTPNPVEMEFEGEITSGSGNVYIGD